MVKLNILFVTLSILLGLTSSARGYTGKTGKFVLHNFIVIIFGRKYLAQSCVVLCVCVCFEIRMKFAYISFTVLKLTPYYAETGKRI